MKKIFFSPLLLFITSFLTICLIFPLSSFPQETLNITTYYPAPVGVYQRLVTSTLGVGDTNGDGFLTSADAPNPTGGPPNNGDGVIWMNRMVVQDVITVDNLIANNSLGIGITNPRRQLHIHAAGANAAGIKMTNTPSGFGNSQGFDLSLLANLTTRIWNWENGPMIFGTNALERMRITQDGANATKIGIGTNDPKNILDVEGAMVVGAGYSGTETAPAGTDLLVEGSVGIGTTTPKNKLDVEGAAVIGTSYSGTNTAPAGTDLLVEGNTAIGATDPLGNKLYVFGNQRITGTLTVNGNLDMSASNLTVNNLTVNNDAAITGNLTVGGNINGSDVAEDVECPDCETTDVVIIDERHNQTLMPSNKPYDYKVAGIISETPTLYMGKKESNTAKPLALVGQVRCKVTSEGGPIKRGDLLVTSSKSGYAMRADIDKIKPGMIVGRALEPLEKGEGKIVVLIGG